MPERTISKPDAVTNQRVQPERSAMLLDAKETTPVSGGASFTLANRIERLLWQIIWTFFARWTPAMFSPWRIWLLELFGATVAKGAMIAASTKVWLPRNLFLGANASVGPGVNCYTQGEIHIGARTIISQGTHLCAGSHDVSDEDFQLITRPIHIGDDVWIAAEAFVAPGVTIGDGAVLAARGCAFGDLDPWTIYRGNPAEKLKLRQWRSRPGPVPASLADTEKKE